MNRGKWEKMNVAYQNTEHERTFRKGNFKVGDPDAGVTGCDLRCEHKNISAE